MRRALALLPLLAAVACGGDPGPPREPIAIEPPTTSPTPTKAPAKPTATATPTGTPSPTPTSPPPATGAIATTKGAVLAAAEPGQPRKVSGTSDCASVFPDITGPKCYALTLDGGDALWVTGRVEGAAVVRVLTKAQEGYVTRYAGREGGSKWQAVNAFATPLTGRGTDGLVVAVRLRDGALTYDLLTWVKGGPLVLRAHRGPLADGRVVPREGRLDDYQLFPDGNYARRVIAWDGRYFRVSSPTAVHPANVPPP